MILFEYLIKGLNAMSHAHIINTMAGHLGAAVIAGYFISEQHPHLDAKVCTGIERELNRIINGESVFSPPENSPITVRDLFTPLPEETPKPELVDKIAEALAGNIDQLHESGHNTIFASIAIRALTDHPDLATPSVIDGICQLIADFNGTKPGSGYYGKQRGRINGREVELQKENDFAAYADLTAMADVVIEELTKTAGKRMVGFGGLWHIINHAAALVELATYGYPELAMIGLKAHHKHVRLFRSLPDVADELGPETPTKHDPRTPEFWETEQIRRERAHLTHRIKTLYGFDVLVKLATNQENRTSANEKPLYLM